MPLEPGDAYFENGLMVFTEQYHRKRGSCCGNDCRHCPYDHENVPKPTRNRDREIEDAERE